jgi:hypothetical protein
MSHDPFANVDPRLARAMVQAASVPWTEPFDVDLVLDVLDDEPDNALAAIVYAYLVCYHLFDDMNVPRARQLLEGAMDRGEEVGAAALLYVDLDSWDDVDRDDELTYIQRSIAAEPTWTLGYLHLSWFYKSRRNSKERRLAFARAVENRLPEGITLSPLQEAYETMFTGRLHRLTF